MRKIILIFGIVFTSILVSGQENKISTGLASSVDYYNMFDFKSIVGFNHKYETNSAYSIGLRFQYNINEKLSLRSGLLYSEKGYKKNYNYIFMDAGDPLIPKESNLKISYLNVPLIIGYYLINKGNIKFSSSTGIISEFLISNTEISVFEDNSERNSEFLNQNLNGILLSAQVNVGLEYHMGKNLFFTIEPYVRYGINKIDDVIMNSNPISYGGILSVNYKL
ncbi:MAG: PorT family protein [Bacteroidales bacterium]|nr:PorT family protein [Bacteroidales bacterium]